MATQNSKRTLLFVLLAVAGVIVVSKLLTNVPGPRPSRAASAEAINLISYVRDMRPGHADFSRSAGSSTVVGNIAGSPDSTGLPVYTGSGAVLTTPWRDRQGRNIAPSLYDASAPEGSTYCLLRQPNIDNQAVVDSWDPLMGPYNVTSAAPAPPLVTSFTMPPVSVPQALSVTPTAGVTYDGNTNPVLSADVVCSQFIVQNSAILRVSGRRTVVCTGLFKVYNRSAIVFDPDSSLTVYASGRIVFRNHVDVNADTFDPNRFTLYNLGTSTIEVAQNVRVVGRLISPAGAMDMSNSGEWFGTIMGNTLSLDNTSGLHLVNEGSACLRLIDTAGARGAASTGSITSTQTFADWFNNVPGTNAGAVRTVTLTKDAQGVYTFSSPAFAPIDGSLYGNQGQAHNRDFTLQAKALFDTSNCGGQFIEIRTDGDMWMFVDNRMVVDIGGIGPVTTQMVEIDRLRLNPSTRHRITFYYAQRSSTNTFLGIRTNIPLIPDTADYPPTTEGYD